MIKKRILRGMVAVAVMTTMAATPVFATDSLEAQKANAQSQASSLQAQLTEMMTKISNLEVNITNKNTEISKAEVQLTDAQALEAKQYEDMKLRIKYMYEDGNTTLLENILKSGTFSEMLSQIEYAQNISNYDRNALNEYQNTVQQVTDLKSSLETEAADLKSMEKSYSAEKENLDATLLSKQSEIANLDEQIQAAAAAAAAAAAEAQRQAEEAAQAQAAAVAAQQAANNGGTTDTTPTTPTDTTVTTPPASNDSNSAGDVSGQRATIVSAAYSQLGGMYQWGGTTPGGGLDCSGLTQYCYAQAGISIGRVDTAQLAGGTITSNPQPGDICWTPGHVAIYIGNGQMIEAQQDGVPICVSSVRATYYVTYL